MAFNLLVLASVGVLLHRVLFHGEQMALIMELPLYQLHKFHSISFQVWHRTPALLSRAGTLILAVSVIVWILAIVPGPTTEASLLAGLGLLLAPVGRWMGPDWRMMADLPSSFIAKENTIATLGCFTILVKVQLA